MALYILVSGEVQGVGFRHFTRKEALQRKLVGKVRNLKNGKVEIWVDGPKPTLDEFCLVLKKGPQHAKVQDLEVQTRNENLNMTTFQISFDGENQ